VAACPDHLLELHTQAGRKSSVLPPAQRERCTGCAQCIPVCHFGAIRMKRLDGGAAA
jgi:Fe-S-cluster-containing hydrogenase component 2